MLWILQLKRDLPFSSLPGPEARRIPETRRLNFPSNAVRYQTHVLPHRARASLPHRDIGYARYRLSSNLRTPDGEAIFTLGLPGDIPFSARI